MSELILVTGANGYIASRLIPRLLERGYRVRALARQAQSLAGREWLSHIEVVEGDVTESENLSAALEEVHTAYYLIHNMSSGNGYTLRELDGARNFISAAMEANLQHVIYLGGLANPEDKPIAPHMLSRIETGEVLSSGKVPVTEFRAGVIAGSGSISFEMIRFMTELSPIVIGPSWLKNYSQPISIQNVIDYLMAALGNPDGRGQIFEIGGPDAMKYSDLMLSYARVRGLRRGLITLPGIPVSLMARVVDWMTPVPRPIAYALIEGLAADSVVQHDEARRIFPNVKLIGYEAATREAIAKLSPMNVERVWEGFHRDVTNFKHEGFFISCCRVEVNALPEKIFSVLTSLGGRNGWPYANWLWQLRGWLDKLFGGARAPLLLGEEPGVRLGDYIDYYRVECLESNHLMLLHSELRAPGEGWMEWRIDNHTLTQTAFFAPRGFGGFLYWYLLYPFHTLVFRGLIRAIAKRSESK
ncbi:MAG: DUF2867 domain-containing protein [Chloroflexi bacterium]|nr:DUF2867 domain-containing protein [Chloroflexota bacterium]